MPSSYVGMISSTMIHKDPVIKELGFLVESIRGSFFVAQMFLEKWFKPLHFEKVKQPSTTDINMCFLLRGLA